ncbi:piggyBac transposable element-derived protein 4-like [Cheilinus undulatus]|uniref:piggyBac transposable element-derived protein 4-like n=1 Tax=Cheilinus undulatus TaxID=241271 RepID=UPI001BD5E934|nr:piggyBac transposable element-derived protein 4-like [Cheilinus undulatus]
MTKRTKKTKHTVPEPLNSGDKEQERDESEGEMSEEVDRQPSDVGSDSEWEPPLVSKRPRGGEGQESSSVAESSPPAFKRCASSKKKPRGTRKGRGRGRGRGINSSSSQASSETPGQGWNGVDVPDIVPPQPIFRPARTPGPQLILTSSYTALQLFQLFLTKPSLKTIVQNTNDFGIAYYAKISSPWTDFTIEDMYSFMSLLIYMGLVKCTAFLDYWKDSNLYNFQFPRQVMAVKRFLRINQALHLCSPEADAENERKKGTADFDHLCKIKPLYEEIKEACKRSYHPSQEIAIDERIIATKSRTGPKQHLNNDSVRWGYKLFVLADSNNAYTWDFFVYDGKMEKKSGKGLGYDSVMELMDSRLLGSGYKLFVDSFFTSPALFRDLLEKKIWACGTILKNNSGFPKTGVDGLDSKSPRGSIRWIRDDSVLFLQWRDAKEVLLCSTLHTAHTDDKVKRRVRNAEGQGVLKDVSIPPAAKDYNQFIGGVDFSDSLIGYYSVNHKTRMWYKTFFYHFMDVAIVNAYILHKEIAKSKGEVPLPQKAFRETLAQELAEVGSRPKTKPMPPPGSSGASHRLVHISGDSTVGRRTCKLCQKKTPVKCTSCDIPLCFVPARDCYNEWHAAHNL